MGKSEAITMGYRIERKPVILILKSLRLKKKKKNLKNPEGLIVEKMAI